MADSSLASGSPSLNQLRKAIAYLPTYAGALLIPLLPIGIFAGVHHPAFTLIFVAHGIVLLTAVCSSIFFFIGCARKVVLSAVPIVGSFLLFTIMLVAVGLLPITARDALIHHLAVPNWWVQAGYIIKIPWHEWSYYPMLIDLGYTGLLSYGLEGLTPFYHACYLLLLCGTVASFTLYKTKDKDIAALSYLLTLTLPACFKLASIPLVDLGLALYSTQALCHFIYWAEGKHRWSHLFILGTGFGLAMSCKYNGNLAAAVFAPLAIIYLARARLGIEKLFSLVIIASFFAIVVYSPWLLKNWAWTNNPIYPLFNSLFTSTKTPAMLSHGVSPIEMRLSVYNEHWYDLLLMPLRMLFTGEDDNPRRFDGLLSPALLFAIVPFVKLRKEHWVNLLSLHTIFYFCFAVLLSSARVRYLAPVFGSLAILSAVGIHELGKRSFGSNRKMTYLISACIFLVWGDFYAATMTRSLGSAEYLLGKQSKHEYLTANLPEFAMIDFMNRTMPDTSKTYLLNTGNRFYYYEHPVISGGHYSAGQIIHWIKNSPNSDALLSAFRGDKITHIMLDTVLTRSTLQNSLSPEEIERWNDFQAKHLTLLYVARFFSLWEIQ